MATNAPLYVHRFHIDQNFTAGIVTYRGKFVAFSMEDTVRQLKARSDKLAGVTAIPAGTYSIRTSMSRRFGREMIELLNVPWFEGIRIHAGNDATKSEGCILVGQEWSFKAPGWIGKSRMTEDALLKLVKQNKIDTIVITEAKR